METITLPGSRKITTRIGFGCAYLLPENARLLDAAFDAGIRHFDVARSYGRGFTEGLVGRFLGRHGEEVTVTTKYGILPPPNAPLVGALKGALRPLVRRLRRAPAVDRQISRSIAALYGKAAFSGDEARRSLALSLKRLSRDRVDLFLMHEAEASDLGDPSLLDTLLKLRDRQIIGAFGVGGLARRTPDLIAARPGFCDVLQHEWTVGDPVIDTAQGFRILYRTFGGAAAQAFARVSGDEVALGAWSDQVGVDLAERGAFQRLLLKAAYQRRPEAMILFSSTRVENIAANVRTLEDTALAAAADRLADLVEAARTTGAPHEG